MRRFIITTIIETKYEVLAETKEEAKAIYFQNRKETFRSKVATEKIEEDEDFEDEDDFEGTGMSEEDIHNLSNEDMEDMDLYDEEEEDD